MTAVDILLIVLLLLLITVLSVLRWRYSRQPEEPAVLESGRRSERQRISRD
jgi:hypothetical protein